MFLKQLEILGFKSFGHKTGIRFSSGVTAIVGPNGCGKTNVLDSLRWVLGEQKTTLLRSGKMEEVIFNGTRDVKPLNMAEVTLTIVNNRGVLPTEYSEVQVTRRLFRSGESEYLLNKVPCRLKDIIELFLDTGMGAHSYSVIQMDMIDALLSDKPEERRFLFEEASGITKYKQRKKAALRKLDATDNDFLRLKDIHAEVKTRVNSLHRQHKKADRYQKVVEDIRQWELFLGATRTRAIEQKRREIKAELDRLSEGKVDKETTLDQINAQLESDRRELVDIERRLNEVGSGIYATTEEAHSREKEVSIAGEKKANAVALIEKNTADVESFKYRIMSLDEQIEEATGELSEHRSGLDRISGDLKLAEERQAVNDRRLLQARTAKEGENKLLIALEGKLSSEKTEEKNLVEQEQETTTSLESIKAQLEHNRPHQDDLLGELEQTQSELDRLGSNKTDMETRQADLVREMEELDIAGDDLTADISNMMASLEACEARRNLLEDMMVQYEGYESGMVAVMEQRETWPGIAGTVGDQFVPVEGLESALEMALGGLAKCLICNDRSTAESIISYLKAEAKGKIGILVPDMGSINPAVKRPEIEHENFVGWLDSFVSAGEQLRPLKEAVLSRTAVFKAGTSAAPLLELLPYGFSAVSTDGVLYSTNLISGGSEDLFPLFRRKEKIQEQEEMIAELSGKLETAREAKNRGEARIAALRAESQKLTGELVNIAEEAEQVQKKLSELDFQRRTLIGEFERLDKERQALAAKLEGVKNRQYELGLGFTQLSNERDDLVSTMNQSGNDLADLEQEAARAVEDVSRLQVTLIETRSKVEQTEGQIGHIEEIKADLEVTIDVKTEENAQARRDIETSANRMATYEVELKELFDKRDQLTTSQASAREVQSEIQERLQGREKQIKQIRQEKDESLEGIHQLEIRVNSIEAETKAIRDRVLEDYELDINTVDPERPDDDVSDDEARDRLSAQKEKLKKFGAVNLLALEEYQVANEREKFLDEQLGDLEKAKKDLLSTINKINTTARELFNETFANVRKNFRSLFVELFNGGEADIMLVDTDDPLESNIEIVARPRGKKILSIAQMSGGERALTAISLLFSLYMEKPSPFCILDEIDAPLDDANCHRFLKIIRNFSRQTQFLIITHNKITMEAADNLYGITMEEAGISKLVAVKFNEAEEYMVEDESVDSFAEAARAAETEVPTNGELPEPIKERINPAVNITRDEES